MSSHFCNILHGLKPAMAMVLVQFVFAGVNVLYKLARNDGMSLTVMVAYRYIFATAFVAPLAFIFERKSRPKLTWTLVFQSFLCGLFGGSLYQNLYVASFASTSVTFISAMTNLIPPITFIIALFFRLERLDLGTVSGKAKVFGTMLGIGGALILTFYKGVEINIWSTNINLLNHNHHGGVHVAKSPGNSLLGSFYAVGMCVSFAIWLIIQAKMSVKYPCYYSSTAMLSFMASVQSVIFSICIEKGNWEVWRLGWNIRLLTVAFSGIAGSGMMIVLIAWCVRLRGPVFVSTFNPLLFMIVAVVGSLVLDEKLHLGSILAAVLIVPGLYLVLWGKAKEMKRTTQLMPSNSSKELASIEVVVASSLPEKKLNDHSDNQIVNATNNTVVASDGPPVMAIDASDINSLVEEPK